MLKDPGKYDPEFIKSLQDLRNDINELFLIFRKKYPQAKVRTSVVDYKDNSGNNHEYVEFVANEKDDFSVNAEFNSY